MKLHKLLSTIDEKEVRIWHGSDRFTENPNALLEHDPVMFVAVTTTKKGKTKTVDLRPSNAKVIRCYLNEALINVEVKLK